MNEAEALADQVPCLLDAILDTESLDCLIVTLELFKALQDVSRHFGLGELTHPVEAVVTKNWHYAGQNLTIDAGTATVGDPVHKDLVVEEELRNDEVSSCIYLLLQEADVVFT